MRNGGIGGSLFLIAIGAILSFAVTVQAQGFNINTVGLILMIVGGAGIVLTFILTAASDTKDDDTDVKVVES